MTTLQELIAAVPGPDEEARQAAYERWQAVAKPLGALGLLEDTVCRMAAAAGTADVRIDSRALAVFCADNGVLAEGVAQTDHTITTLVTRALALGHSTVCHMARHARCRVVPVDMGVLDFAGMPGVLNRRIRNGTGNIAREPAMTRAQCEQAILTGATLAMDLHRQGTDILLTGEMGIGNTTTTSAVTAVLLDAPPAEVTGRGAGLSGEGLARKIRTIETAIARSHADPADPVEVLAQLGGLDLAALCGAFLGAAACRMPVVIDGFISAAAALCAVRLCPKAQAALVASHVSDEPASRMVLEALGLEPLITAKMHLGEGSGAVTLLPMLDMALEVYHSGLTFGQFGMDAYTPQQ